MEKNYNSLRRKLPLPEYGRNITQMVDYLLSIKDRDLRSSQARIVIGVMGNINPVLRDAADFTHKLWDHLHIIAGFKLDVDSPYPIPTLETLSPKPERLNYPFRKIKFRQYGHHIECMLEQIEGVEDDGLRAEQALAIARYMRAKAYDFGQDNLNADRILYDLRKMSPAAGLLTEEVIANGQPDLPQRPHKIGVTPGSAKKSNGRRKAKTRVTYR